MKSNFGTGVEKFLFRKRRDHWPNRSCVFRHRFVKSSLGFLRSLLRERVFKWSFQSILETLCSNLYDSAFSIVHLLPFFPFFLFFFLSLFLFEKKAISPIFSFPIRLQSRIDWRHYSSYTIINHFSTTMSVTCLTRDISLEKKWEFKHSSTWISSPSSLLWNEN